MPECPTCETQFSDELEACPECAAAEVRRCPRCGEDHRGGDACPACGHLHTEVPCDVHEDRQAIGRCVVCGRAICEKCRAGDNRAHLCDDHGAVTVIEGWAQVYSTASEFDASLVRENLEAEGVDARIFSQRDRAFSVDLGELSIVRVLVPVFAYQKAVALIRRHVDDDGELTFACASCGEAYEEGSRECVACGSPLA